jgi:phosphatidylinositol alpha-mannosyltransferase
MRIAMVSPYDLQVPGGVQGQVQGLAAALGGLGHQVVVLAPGTPPGVRADGVVFLGRSVGVRANGSVAPVSISPLAAKRAAAEVRSGRYDVIHLHEPLAPAGNYGCLLVARQPIVGTLHRQGSSAFYRLLAPAARFALGRLSACCAVSTAARDNVAGLVRGEVEILFNGIDLERFGGERPVRRPIPTVLFVGRHEPRKGLAVLLEAFARLAEPAQLWVAGAGPQTAELRRRYPPSDRLVWLGEISEDEKAERLAAADVFCAPSLGGESFGMVLLEALATGLCLVASDIDGYRDVAAGYARLVRPGDADALAAALQDVLADVGAQQGRAAPEALAAERRYAAGWSMEELARRYVGIYERVLDETGSERRRK